MVVKNPKRLPIQTVAIISMQVYKGYIYTADGVDSWNSYSADQIAGKIWRGDCDDLTSTTLDMLYRAGQPLDKMWMLLNNVESHGTMDHIVGIIQAADGKYYVVGNTNEKANVFPLEMLAFSPRSIVRMDERNNWVSPLVSPVFKNYPNLLGIPSKPKAPQIHPRQYKSRR
jgi:hypothetical protein